MISDYNTIKVWLRQEVEALWSINFDAERQRQRGGALCEKRRVAWRQRRA